MSLPYEGATAGDRALAEANRILAKFGCSQFGTMVDQEKGCTIVQFRYRTRTISLEASWKGYAAAWLKEHPLPNRYNGPTTQEWHRRALEIGKVASASILRDWIKGQITAVETGVMAFDAVFMPFVLLPTGERIIDRVGQELLPQLPAPEDKVVGIKP
jgi:hypothetical protein